MKKRLLCIIVMLTALSSCGKALDSPKVSGEQQTDIPQSSTSITATTTTTTSQTTTGTSTAKTTKAEPTAENNNVQIQN